MADGLLGQGFDDPRTAQINALAAGLLSANGSQGLSAGILGMNQARSESLKQQDLAQQIQLRNIALQQQQQEWALQLPLLKAMSERMNGAGQPQGAGAAPSAPAIPASGGGALGSGTFGMSLGGQPASAPQTGTPQPSMGSSMFPGVPDNVAYPTAAFGGLKAVLPLMSKYNEPTDLMKSLTAAGYQPGSPEWNQAIQASVTKSNYIAPVNARPGSILRDPVTGKPFAFNPHVPDGTSPAFDANGNVTAFNPIPGALPAISALETAKTTGVAEATPSISYDASGKPIYSTKGQDLRRASGAAPAAAPTAQPGVSGRFNLNDPALLAGINDIKDPQERANAFSALQAQLSGGATAPAASTDNALTPVPKLGAEKGATLSQTELSDKGKQLMADNGQTNTVISRLQNIKMLAPGAITGAESGRRDFFNGLLSLAGVQGAADAKTASDLVDKNKDQIVSALRMGQGGGGTDALQTLLGTANPNRHMTGQAIQEAADQLIASQKMIQAKAQLLQPHYVGRDPISYGNKELQFDQNADPRVWQLQSMNPQQQAAYVKTLPAEVAADMLKKRQALKSLGVLQ